MTVYSEVNKITYIGSSEQTLYPIPFEYINNDNIVVSIYSSDNKPLETWTYSTEYVVEGNSVRVLEGYQIDNSKKMLIERKLDIVQDNKYREGGDFPAKSTETSFDKLTMIAQQQKDELSRCPKVDSVYNINLTLPAPENGKALIWNEGENGFQNSMVDVDELEAQTKDYRDQAEASKNAAQLSEANAKSSELSAAQSAKSAANTVNGFDAHAAEKQSQFDSNAESKTNTFNTNAAQKQAAVDASAETARKWAVGTLQEQSQGSAKYWAEQAQIATDGTLNYTNITNCITAIPQDIKLELNNGMLTLKAGSKVYRGDGTVINITKDIKTNGGAAYPNKFIFVNADLVLYVTGNVYSGDSAPSGRLYLGDMWYDTTNKVVKRYDRSVWEGSYSLPICVCTTSGTGVTSIDQVFNGFGYIGSTIFALPGVSGLIPNGRNEDGSLNSTSFTTTSVVTVQYTGTASVYIVLTSNFIATVAKTNYYYDEENNYHYRISPNLKLQYAVVAEVDFASGVITSFNPKPVFQAQDYHTAARVGDDNVFTGNNTFLEPIERKEDFDTTVTPSTNTFYNMLSLRDKNDKIIGQVDVWKNHTNNDTNLRLQCTNPSGETAFITVGAKTNGSQYFVCPTPESSANDTQGATTAWVRGVSQRFVNYSSSVSVGVPTSTSMFTAPADGEWVGCIGTNYESGTCSAYINGKISGYVSQNGGGYYGNKSPYSIPLKKGETLYFVTSAGSPVKLPDTSNNSVFYSYI